MPDPTQSPIQDDVAAGVNAGNVAPTETVNVAGGNPPMQSAQNPPGQQPGQQPGVQPAPSAQAPSAPSANAPQPQGPNSAQPQQQPPKPTLRSHIFDTILAAGAGKPVQGPDGKPIPMTRGFMGKAIIANALAGMMAGYGTNEYVNGKFGPTLVTNPGKAFAAGGAASNAMQNQRQQAMDDSRGRAYVTLKRNLDTHASMLNLQKASDEYQDKAANDGLAMQNALEEASESNNDPKAPKPFLGKGLIGQEITDGMTGKKYNITRDNAILVGWRDHTDPQTGKLTVDDAGVPQREPVFDLVNPEALAHLTDDLKGSLSGTGQDLSKIPVNASIQVKALLPLLQNKMYAHTAQDAVNGWSAKNDELTGKKSETVDVSKLMETDPIIRRAAKYINMWIGKDPDEMLNGLRASKDPSAQAAAGILASKLGIDEDAWKNKREAENKKIAADQNVATKLAEDSALSRTPEGQAKLKGIQLENQIKQQQIAQADAHTKGVNVPKNFVGNPKSNEMDSGALQSDLMAKGVDVPSNFSALYAIAHNASDLSTLPTNPRKGTSDMSRENGLAYIRTFINPLYQEGDYSASKKLSGELASTRTGTAGGTLLSAGTAANHLNMLEQAGQALNNNDVQAINKLANVVGVAVGKSPAVTFQAIAEQVNSEVAKVVAGGQPNEAELKQNRDNLNNSQSPEQIRNVIRSYVGLMNGRIGEIDDRSMQYFGRHVKGISPTAVQVFNQHGFAAPGQVVVVDPTGKQRFFNDAASANNFKKLAGIQ